MIKYEDFLVEGANGVITKSGDNLISKFVQIKGVSKLIVAELNKYDEEQFKTKNVYIKNSQLTWSASITPSNLLEIDFTDKTTDVEVDGKSIGDVEYTGKLIIDVLEGTVKAEINTKGNKK